MLRIALLLFIATILLAGLGYRLMLPASSSLMPTNDVFWLIGPLVFNIHWLGSMVITLRGLFQLNTNSSVGWSIKTRTVVSPWPDDNFSSNDVLKNGVRLGADCRPLACAHSMLKPG